MPFGLSPNVSGRLYSIRSMHANTDDGKSLYWVTPTSQKMETSMAETQDYHLDIALDASRSSSIFGKSSKVQPSSYQLLIIIKA